MIRRGDYYYLFASYGALENQYTIRMGRSKSPTGPFLDKDGVDMMNFGSSFLLGDEEEHLVPGHPTFWEDKGRLLMGYDYRFKKGFGFDFEPGDFGAIHEMHIVNDWPTIWSPLTITVDADDHPDSIGKPLVVRLLNIGTEDSMIGVDHVSIKVTD